jgi:hypothetical protein
MMAILSLSLPSRYLIDDALDLFRRRDKRREPVRRKSARGPEPEAFELVAANYQECGYQAPTDKPYRFTPYHTLPDTFVFVAKHEGRVLATFSLVADNTLLGLPMEAIYGEEIAALRREGRRLAEVTSLASADLGPREFLQVFTALIRLMKQYHVSRGGDTWVIAVNPRHRTFYQKILGYRPLGPCRAYAAVGNAPAEAYLLDRDLMRANAPDTYKFIFGESLPPAALTGVSVPRPFIRYFWAQSKQADESRLGDLLDSVSAFGSPRAW